MCPCPPRRPCPWPCLWVGRRGGEWNAGNRSPPSSSSSSGRSSKALERRDVVGGATMLGLGVCPREGAGERGGCSGAGAGALKLNAFVLRACCCDGGGGRTNVDDEGGGEWKAENWSSSSSSGVSKALERREVVGGAMMLGLGVCPQEGAGERGGCSGAGGGTLKLNASALRACWGGGCGSGNVFRACSGGGVCL